MIDYIIVIISIILILLLKSYYDKEILILFNETESNKNIINKWNSKIKSYFPTFYLFNFIMMIGYHLLSKPKKFGFKEIFIKTRDNAKIKLELLGEDFDKKPLIIFKYGVNGNSNANYVLVFSKIIKKYGFNLIIVNNRLMEDNFSDKLLGHHDIKDFEDCIDFINKNFKCKNKFLFGISLGSNYLTKYLGETEQDHKIKSACLIANPFDMLKTCFFLDKNIEGKVVSKLFIKEYKEFISNNLKNYPNYNEIIDQIRSPLSKIKKVGNLFSFDSLLTKKVCGYDSIYDYYEDCQSAKFVKHIKIKTLFINSLNDEISKKENIPINDITKNENCILMMIKNGGHIEFFDGIKPRWFGFEMAVSYFQLFLD